jgi:hypothetical protein
MPVPSPVFWLRKDAVRPAGPVVSDRKLPIRSIDIIGDDYPPIDFIGGERMLQGIHHKLGGDQAEALGLTGRRAAALSDHLG